MNLVFSFRITSLLTTAAFCLLSFALEPGVESVGGQGKSNEEMRAPKNNLQLCAVAPR